MQYEAWEDGTGDGAGDVCGDGVGDGDGKRLLRRNWRWRFSSSISITPAVLIRAVRGLDLLGPEVLLLLLLVMVLVLLLLLLLLEVLVQVQVSDAYEHDTFTFLTGGTVITASPSSVVIFINFDANFSVCWCWFLLVVGVWW